MKPEKKTSNPKRLKELFVQDLARVEGGTGVAQDHKDKSPYCPELTTLACGEEAPECSGC